MKRLGRLASGSPLRARASGLPLRTWLAALCCCFCLWAVPSLADEDLGECCACRYAAECNSPLSRSLASLAKVEGGGQSLLGNHPRGLFFNNAGNALFSAADGIFGALRRLLL